MVNAANSEQLAIHWINIGVEYSAFETVCVEGADLIVVIRTGHFANCWPQWTPQRAAI